MEINDVVNDVPAPTRRRWIAVGIGLFLLSQILIPATYYFSDEPTSERFAWRMFSSVHMSSWDTQIVALVEKDGQVIEHVIPLERILGETYLKTVRAAQLDIVKPFMHQIADQGGVKEVRYIAKGTYPSGKTMKPIRLSLKPGGDVETMPE